MRKILVIGILILVLLSALLVGCTQLVGEASSKNSSGEGASDGDLDDGLNPDFIDDNDTAEIGEII